MKLFIALQALIFGSRNYGNGNDYAVGDYIRSYWYSI